MFRLSVKRLCQVSTPHGDQPPCSMAPTSLCCLSQCRIADKHIVILFQGFARFKFKLSTFAEVQARHRQTRDCRFEPDHLPCSCSQLLVCAFPLRPMIRHCAICKQAESQEAHTQERTWLIVIRQNNPVRPVTPNSSKC